MKKATSKKGSSMKGKGATGSVDEYIAGVPETGRAALKKMRETIRSVVPAEAAEVISYGIPAFKHDGIIVWYAAFSDHCSLFPTAAVIQEFKVELKGFSTSKGTIHFSLDKPLPVALIKRIVKARVARAKRRIVEA